jgi:hypothetical protein
LLVIRTNAARKWSALARKFKRRNLGRTAPQLSPIHGHAEHICSNVNVATAGILVETGAMADGCVAAAAYVVAECVRAKGVVGCPALVREKRPNTDHIAAFGHVRDKRAIADGCVLIAVDVV